jgi:hypothetical protein
VNDDMTDRDERPGLPLPSEDEGDLVDPPASGETDDPLIATQEGVPWVPPSDRVLSDARYAESGPDVAGSAPTDAGELEREDDIQLDDGRRPVDDELRADVIERLRASEVPSGDRLQVATVGSTVTLQGEVESIDILEELLGIVGEVPGVEEVIDEVRFTGI